MSDERKYYCFCEDNCKFETMTKEQILAAIAQAIATGNVGECDTGFITKVKETNGGSCITFWVGTNAQYNALATKEKNCVYIISDDVFTEDLHKVIFQLQESVATAESVAAEARAKATSAARIIAPSFDDGKSYKYMYDEAELDAWLTAEMNELFKVSPAAKVSGFYFEDLFKTTTFITVTINVGLEKHGAIAEFVADVNGCPTRWRKSYDFTLGWSPLEWENPLLEDGVEYRTTERWNGAPVYVRRLYRQLDGTAGSARIVTIDGIAGANVVDYRVILKHSSGSVFMCPAFATDGSLAAHASAYVDKTTAEITITPITGECANCTAEIVVKYTK